MPDVASSVIDALPCSAREILLARAIARRLERGERLYLRGEPSPRLHVVARGVIKLVAGDDRGREAIAALALPGEVVEHAAAIDGLEHSLDAVAATNAEIVGFDARAFRSALAQHPVALMQFTLELAARSRWICNASIERASSPAMRRLAGRLLDLAEMLGRMNQGTIELEMPLTQAELGSLAGLSRERTSTELSSLRARGVVDYQRRKLRILRPDVLQRLRCGAH